MTDLIDKAQEYGDLMLENQIKNRQQFDLPSLKECDECGDEIPQKRRDLGGVRYCVYCQERKERRK